MGDREQLKTRSNSDRICIFLKFLIRPCHPFPADLHFLFRRVKLAILSQLGGIRFRPCHIASG